MCFANYSRLAACLIVACAVSRIAERVAVAEQPNIIFILADDLGYGDLGSYAQERIQTPHLDRMASEGMRFTQFYAGSTVCAPSRSVLMTGRHVGHTTIRGNGDFPIRDDDVTVAEVLQGAGYQTGIVGKWGLGNLENGSDPLNQGFDHFFGYLHHRHAHNYYPSHLYRNQQRAPLGNVVPDEDKTGAGVATKKVDYTHDLLADDALEFVDRNKDRRFFLYLALTIPHANNEARSAGMEVPDYGAYADKSWPEPQKGHAAMISRMDADVGRLFERLKRHGIDEETIVIFTSDNGPHREGGNDPDFQDSNGPLRGIKRDMYEGGIRVPMIVRWPGVVEAGSVSDIVGSFADFMPTAAALAEVEPPADIDGISFLPTLLGQQQPQHDYLYWEFFEQGGKRAVRFGPWKAIQLDVIASGGESPIELYNLDDDLGEMNDVSAEHPKIVQQARQLFEEARTESPIPQFNFSTAETK